MTDTVTFVGHATVLLELGGVRVLTDPLFRDRLGTRIGALRRHGSPPSPEVMERIDAVLISHLHYDHLDLPSLRRLGPSTRLLAPRGAGAFLRRNGFDDVAELVVGESARVKDLEVVAVPAVHDGRRRPLGPVADAVGYVIAGGRRAYFAGDTDRFDEMADLRPGLDLALLPVWGWGPQVGPGHLDPQSAARAAALLRPRLAVPIHWGTLFPLGLARRHEDRLREPPREFAAELAELAPEVEVRILEPGDSLILPG
jgi:L-ascorbate metabolism protein UlaG (beta-lactamase superfamily)